MDGEGPGRVSEDWSKSKRAVEAKEEEDRRERSGGGGSEERQ